MPLMAIIHEPSAISATEGGLTAFRLRHTVAAEGGISARRARHLIIQHSAFSIQY